MNRIKERIFKKPKKLMGICSLVIFITAILVYYLVHEKPVPLTLNSKEIEVEYGQVPKLEPELYVSLKKFSKEKKKEILKDIKISSDIVNEEGKEYPSLGTYTVVVKYQKQILKKELLIKDTTAPEFNDVGEVTFEEGTTYNYGEVIQASDLQEVTYTFDDSQVNANVAGEYVLKVIAKDKSENQSEKEIKVIVTAKPVVKEPEVNNSSSTSSASVNRKQGSNSSSNSSAQAKPNSTNETNAPASVPEKPHVHENSTFGKYFESKSAADQYAYEYLFSEENIKYSGYGLNYCSCKKIGVVFY